MDLQHLFNKHLEVACEENPNRSYTQQVNLALEWSIADVTGQLVKIADRLEWEHINSINKVFYD